MGGGGYYPTESGGYNGTNSVRMPEDIIRLSNKPYPGVEYQNKVIRLASAVNCFVQLADGVAACRIPD